MVKVDLQTNKGTMIQFARFAVQVKLSKPLVSKIKVASQLHRVEYESFPLICFQCGRFGHLKEGCPHGDMGRNMGNDRVSDQKRNTEEKVESNNKKIEVHDKVEKEDFGEWMVMDRRKW